MIRCGGAIPAARWLLVSSMTAAESGGRGTAGAPGATAEAARGCPQAGQTGQSPGPRDSGFVAAPHAGQVHPGMISRD